MIYPEAKKMAALRKIVKIPSVRILRGRVRNKSTGRTNALSSPRTKAPNQQADQSLNQIPGRRNAVTTRDRVLVTQRIKNTFKRILLAPETGRCAVPAWSPGRPHGPPPY